ncbi:MAG: trypsin-like peptidase domain-containing protein [Symploca sp. SIO2G7]|nr:trypsin-like peptidase domain-containing protein [Symploca sp. SIO2G7]
MKRSLFFLAISTASSLFVLVGQNRISPKEAVQDTVEVVEVDSTGILHIRPDESAESLTLGSGSGVYLGHGIVLTNWHIATYAALLLWGEFDLPAEEQLLTYEIGDVDNLLADSWICPVEFNFDSQNTDDQMYEVSPTRNDDCIPYDLTQWITFKPSTPESSLSITPVPLEQLLFVDRDLELAIVKLDAAELAETPITPPCLSTVPIKRGEAVTIQSHVAGVYPAVTVTATVKDEQPKLLLDPDPRIPIENRYAAMSIVATIPAEEAGKVGPGSSGGPVFNEQGNLVGLVWTGQGLADGSQEVWFTPTLSWLPLLEQAKIPDDDLRKVLDTPCPAP